MRTTPPSKSSKTSSSSSKPQRSPANGWKTCSRGHSYRGDHCTKCWPGKKSPHGLH